MKGRRSQRCPFLSSVIGSQPLSGLCCKSCHLPASLPPRTEDARSSVSGSGRRAAVGAQEDRLATHQASGQRPEAAGPLQKATAPGGAEDPRAPAPRAGPISCCCIHLHPSQPLQPRGAPELTRAEERLESCETGPGLGTLQVASNSQKRELPRCQGPPRLSILSAGRSPGSQ